MRWPLILRRERKKERKKEGRIRDGALILSHVEGQDLSCVFVFCQFQLPFPLVLSGCTIYHYPYYRYYYYYYYVLFDHLYSPLLLLISP
ncbi:hypothetical protein P167DRAFT_140295 [Morchella conica CCBAS932]|uniref:Uncharacterized protein n=1 Tax=Morchella conica CCBAS932 TaxID=1392247 RepID=A0A3N4KXD0_9PEZI|nr:hypothetical protein P167DRAFT_140295 [Morchella conica CCBAS932]